MNDKPLPLKPSPESSSTSSETQPTLSNSTPTETTTTTSPTQPTEKAGNSLSLTRGGADGSAIRTGKNKTSLDRFEDTIGGREQLIDTLALSSLDKKQEHFLRLLCDPARQRDSLVTIARDCGLMPIHILDLFRTASFAKAHALAMGHMTEALPGVVKDIADKSIDAKVECPICFGERFIKEGVECTACNGMGQIFRPSDLDRQKLLLDATGVIKRGPGVAVNVQQNVSVGQPSNFFSKYVRASDDAAYDVSDTAVIDVEAVKE